MLYVRSSDLIHLTTVNKSFIQLSSITQFECVTWLLPGPWVTQGGLELLHTSTQWANIYRVGGGMERDAFQCIIQTALFTCGDGRDTFSNSNTGIITLT